MLSEQCQPLGLYLVCCRIDQNSMLVSLLGTVGARIIILMSRGYHLLYFVLWDMSFNFNPQLNCRLKFVWYSDVYLNSRPFKKWYIHHLNAGLVWYSNTHCLSLQSPQLKPVQLGANYRKQNNLFPNRPSKICNLHKR